MHYKKWRVKMDSMGLVTYQKGTTKGVKLTLISAYTLHWSYFNTLCCEF